jgi:hypothetical protein
METIYPHPNDTQHPCFAILHRTSPKYYDWQSDFRGSVTLEDGRFYWIGISVGTDRDGMQILWPYLRPELSKTPVSTGNFGGCAMNLDKLRRVSVEHEYKGRIHGQ